MAETKTVKMLMEVEDSNVFAAHELTDVADHGYGIGGSLVKEGDLIIAVRSVDKFPRDVTVVLPKRQAENLIKLGYAQEVV